jgi:hypothetical protein
VAVAAAAMGFLQKHLVEHEDLHLDEIQRLQAVTSKQQIEENQVTLLFSCTSSLLRRACVRWWLVLTTTTVVRLQVAQKFRKFKSPVRMCRYSANLLVAFLEQPKMTLLLGLANQYLDIKGSVTPSSSPARVSVLSRPFHAWCT